MKTEIELMNTIAPIRNKFNRSPWRRLVFITPIAIPFAIGLISLATSPTARAQDYDCHSICMGNDFGYGPQYCSAVGRDALYTAFDDIDYSCYQIATHDTAMGAYALQLDCGRQL